MWVLGRTCPVLRLTRHNQGIVVNFRWLLTHGNALNNAMKSLTLITTLLSAMVLAVADDSYFPVKTTASIEGITEVQSRMYGRHLERMKEPRLPEFARDVNADIYRVTILPTWGNAIAVRVQKRGELYGLSARRLDGQAGFGTGELVESKDVSLSADDSKTLTELIQNLHFFQMSTNDDIRGFDGDEWIIEGVSQGKYHVAVRWCASSEEPKKRDLKPFLALCKFLVTKSTLSERPKNKGRKLI
jgi:hypothetical protein